MKGYKHKLRDGEDKILAKWTIQATKNDWKQMKSFLIASFLFFLADFSFAQKKTNYTITSNSQINTAKGDLEDIKMYLSKVMVVIPK